MSGDSSWGLLCLPPHKNPFGTSSCWDPACQTETDGLGRHRSGGMDCIAAALLTARETEMGMVEVRAGHLAFPPQLR